jgi:hypothetical protein
MGALIGGVAGGALGGVAEGLARGASKLKPSAARKILDTTTDEGRALVTKVNGATKEIDDASRAIFSDLENAASRKSTEVFDSATARNYDSAMVRHFDEVEKHIDNIESGLYTKYDEVAEAAPGAAGPNGTKVFNRAAKDLDSTAALTKPKASDGTAVITKPKKGAVDVGPAPGPKGSPMAKSRKLLDAAKKSREEFAEFAGRKGALTKEGSIKWDDLRSIKGGDLRKAEKLFTKYQDDVRKMADEAGVNLADEDKLGNVLPGGKGLFDLLADVKVIKKTSAEATAGAKEALDQARAAQAKFKKALGSKGDDAIDFAKIAEKDPEEALSAIKAFDEYSKGLAAAAKITDEGVGGSAKRLAQAEKQISELITEAVGKDGKVPELAEIAVLFGIEEAVLPDLGPASDLLKLYAAYKMVKVAHGGGSAGKEGGKLSQWLRRGVKAGGGRMASKNQFTAAGAVKGAVGREVAGAAFDFVTNGTSKLVNAADTAAYRIQEAMSKSLGAGSKVTKRSAPAATAILNGVSFAGREPDGKLSKQEAFKARSAELSAQVANLPGLQQRVHDSAASVRQVNLGVGDKLAGHAVRTAQFLHDKMPKDPGVLKTFGISTWRPTEADIDKWSRYINAAQDPAGVVERFSNGRMSREDAETLRTLYPGHFNQLQEWIADNLQEMQTGYSYDKRIQISSLMGVPADPVMSRVTVWQNSFAQPEQQSPQQMSIEGNNQETAAQMLQGVRE